MPMPRAPSRDGLMPAASQYFLTSRQGVLRSRCRLASPRPSGTQRAEEGAFLIVPDACPCQVGQERPRRVERDRAIPSNQLARLLKAEAR